MCDRPARGGNKPAAVAQFKGDTLGWMKM